VSVTRLVSRDQEFDHDIARPTIWGNPYTHKDSKIPGVIKVATRDEALRRYVEWLDSRPDLIEMMWRFLKGKRLACHCDDLVVGEVRCHGQIIVAILEDADPRMVSYQR
jgi:hypothetical protein